MLIDKTAVIQDNVTLGKNVIVGPYSVIYSGTVLEDNVIIRSHCAIGTAPEILSDSSTTNLIIKEGTVVNSFVNINLGSSTETQIGKDCFIMNHSYIAHDCVIGDRSIVSSGVRVSGHSLIGSESYLGINSSIHQHSKIGDLCVIGANSFAKGTLQSGLIYVGNPALPIKINQIGFDRSNHTIDFQKKIIDKIRNTYPEFIAE